MLIMTLIWIFLIILNPLFNKKMYKYYLCLIVILYSFMAYHVKFTENMDIARVVQSMKYWYYNDFFYFLNNKMDMDPLSALYYYIIGLTGDYHLIPAISILISYGFSMALIYKVSKYFKLSKLEMNICTFIFLSNFVFFYALSNIRIYMCYTIIAYFIYMELIENKYHKRAIIFYTMAIFFHYACLPFILIRIILIGYKKRTLKRDVLILMGIILLTQIENILSFLNPTSGILHTIYYKLSRYSRYETFGIEYFFNSMIKVCGILFTYFTFSNSFIKYKLNERKFLYYVLLVNITFFLMILNYQFVLRVPNMMILFWIVMMAMMFFKKKEVFFKSPNSYNIVLKNTKIVVICTILVSIFNILFDIKYIIIRNIFFEF